MFTKDKMYKIADDVHWLMLTDVKHIKKVCCVSSFVRSLMPLMSK